MAEEPGFDGELVVNDPATGPVRLRTHLAHPQASAAGGDRSRNGLVVVHGFPHGAGSAATAALTFPELADRLAADAGWVVLAVALRGTSGSAGEFSVRGWLDDVKAAVALLRATPGVGGVWLAGFGEGGSLALCAAGEDPTIRGVATFGARADFEEWAGDARRFADQARATGALGPRPPAAGLDAWTRELREIRPIVTIARIPPRAVLLVHGVDDDRVPMLDARALADAAEGLVELRILTGASHSLRHDPRAVAILLGWLDRQVLDPPLDHAAPPVV